VSGDSVLHTSSTIVSWLRMPAAHRANEEWDRARGAQAPDRGRAISRLRGTPCRSPKHKDSLPTRMCSAPSCFWWCPGPSRTGSCARGFLPVRSHAILPYPASLGSISERWPIPFVPICAAAP